ncbi:MAG TPA: hypothetical protein VGM75_36890 [Pseudonocardiaceae bacterium]
MMAINFRWRADHLPLRLLTATALVIDAVVHIQLAHRYDLNVEGALSQGELFRIEGGVATLAAALILLAANRTTWALAFGTAASALGAALLYRYVDIGPLGPLPDMYEPYWYPAKVVASVAEAAGTAAAAVGLMHRLSTRSRTSSTNLTRGTL